MMPLPWVFVFFLIFFSFLIVSFLISFVYMSVDKVVKSNVKVTSLVLSW